MDFPSVAGCPAERIGTIRTPRTISRIRQGLSSGPAAPCAPLSGSAGARGSIGHDVYEELK